MNLICTGFWMQFIRPIFPETHTNLTTKEVINMSQKKAKFNIVDVIVLLVLVAGIAFIALRMFGGEEPAPTVSDPTELSTFQVTFHANCVSEEIASTLVEGSRSENATRNMDLGKMISFSTGESVCYGFNSDGECIQSAKPGHVSVTMVMELTGIQQETGLQVGQYMLNIGHEMGVRAGNTEIVAVVRDIQHVG